MGPGRRGDDRGWPKPAPRAHRRVRGHADPASARRRARGANGHADPVRAPRGPAGAAQLPDRGLQPRGHRARPCPGPRRGGQLPGHGRCRAGRVEDLHGPVHRHRACPGRVRVPGRHGLRGPRLVRRRARAGRPLGAWPGPQRGLGRRAARRAPLRHGPRLREPRRPVRAGLRADGPAGRDVRQRAQPVLPRALVRADRYALRRRPGARLHAAPGSAGPRAGPQAGPHLRLHARRARDGGRPEPPARRDQPGLVERPRRAPGVRVRAHLAVRPTRPRVRAGGHRDQHLPRPATRSSGTPTCRWRPRSTTP